MTEKEKEEKKKKDIVFKMFRAEVRAIDPNEEGVIDMLIPMSTGSIDRHGESIDPKGWKKYLKEFKKRAILLSSHAYYKLTNQIGELLDLQVVDEGLLARPKYYINQGNEEADWGYKLAVKGMAAFSVGFIPVKWKDNEDADGKDEPTRTYTEQELVEISQVTVPSNRDAIQEMRSKSSDAFTNKLLDDVLGEDGLIEIVEDDKKETSEIEEGEAIELKDVEKPYKNEHSCRLRDPKDFKPDSFKRMKRVSDGKEYSVIMGRLKGKTKLTEQAYRYHKDIWTVSEARKHCKDHKGILFEPAIDKGEEADSNYEKIAEKFCEKYLIYKKKFEDTEKELKALKEEKGLNPGKEKKDDSKTKEDEDGDTVIEIEDSEADDKQTEEKDAGLIEVDEEAIAKAVSDQMSYLVGKVKKDPTQK